MVHALQRAWLRRGGLACVLWPVSIGYRALVALNRFLYRAGLRERRHPGLPVIVVGNVVAGGAGKTPVVIALLDHLQRAGIRAGVVSRGYGRTTRDCREVTPASTAAEVGDEPLLVWRSCRVPVVVATRRSDAARALRDAHPGVQVIVSDDGLQHHALGRDIEICMFDERGAGNGWLLPAGPLREPWPRAVDLVLQPPGMAMGGFTVQRQLADHAVRADGQRIALAELRGRPCAALAGIARPDAFFRMLRERGLQLAATFALPDHDAIDALPPRADPALPLLCTEKDATKLWRHAPQAWAVPLVLTIEPAFWNALDRLLKPKLSSPDGSQTP